MTVWNLKDASEPLIRLIYQAKSIKGLVHHSDRGIITPADCHDFSNRPYLEKIPKDDYPSTMKGMKVCQNGAMRWKSY